ncbi:phage protein Gp36 family protein [Methylogaea oryzae]|uniref:DUF1320 domain-containing protein n=1 Tax=Methylogaea oryzae TaxID=1295382 RepID=A0A8D4VKC6_9GAMM|nr:phage protein Gp36 family protein [Methylogaea oryzae]BBL69698.1 hypothetical protein MoryE10_03040 [Methylogaea oryzae]
MATLIDQAFLVATFGPIEMAQLADRNADGQQDVDPVGEAIAMADGLVMGALASAGLLPLPDPLPAGAAAVLKGYAADLARERLYGAGCPEVVRNRGNDARAWLKAPKIFGLSPAPASPLGSAGMPAHTAPARVFDDAGLEGF